MSESQLFDGEFRGFSVLVVDFASCCQLAVRKKDVESRCEVVEFLVFSHNYVAFAVCIYTFQHFCC